MELPHGLIGDDEAIAELLEDRQQVGRRPCVVAVEVEQHIRVHRDDRGRQRLKRLRLARHAVALEAVEQSTHR
jgi:hypothetical protein